MKTYLALGLVMIVIAAAIWACIPLTRGSQPVDDPGIELDYDHPKTKKPAKKPTTKQAAPKPRSKR